MYSINISSDFFPILGALVVGITGALVSLLRYLQVDKETYEHKKSKDSTAISKLTEEEKEEILTKLEGKLVEKSSESIIWAIYRKTEERLKDFSEVNIAGSVFAETRHRLSNEIFALQRRGNLNLGLGIVVTIVGLVALWYYVLLQDMKNLSDGEFLHFFLPRLSLVFLIEVFAYFFLRLYKNSLNDIKFFQNELTNVESKLTAMQLSFSDDKRPEERICVIGELVRTERNPKATSVAEKESQDFTIELVKTVADIVLKKNQGS